MKMLQRLFRFFSFRADTRSPPDISQSAIDSDEFTRLLCSRRREDLKVLAQKLSERPRTQPKTHA